MKRFFLLAILLMPALAACQSEWSEESVSSLDKSAPRVYYASTEQSAPETKVYADDQLRILWNAEDSIAIFEKNAYPMLFRFEGNDGDNAGSFEQMEDEDDIFWFGAEIEHYVAVYPYDENLAINNDGNVITLTLPEEQKYLENSFGIGANTMVAAGTDKNLRFKNVCGYLCFKLYGENINVLRLALKVNDGERISGKAYVKIGDVIEETDSNGKVINSYVQLQDEPTVSMDQNAEMGIYLTCKTPVALDAAKANYKEFWMVVPPTTFANGFTLYVFDDQDNQYSKSTHKSITIERNHIVRMAPIDVASLQ